MDIYELMQFKNNISKNKDETYNSQPPDFVIRDDDNAQSSKTSFKENSNSFDTNFKKNKKAIHIPNAIIKPFHYRFSEDSRDIYAEDY